MMASCNVFVYGTLKPGERYHDRYCGDLLETARLATVRGNLYHLPHCRYPAMTPGDGWVRGYLLSFRDERALCQIDQLEGYHPNRPAADNEYQRQVVEVFDLVPASDNKNPSERWGRSLGRGWTYFMTLERVRASDGQFLPEGWWSEKHIESPH
jgi:gamma-glutamylcyclotransferase (GGCT)/AIG2-like uncharacterized protein YtfP